MSDFPVRGEILRLLWMAYHAVQNGDKVEFVANQEILTAALHSESGGPYPVPTTYYLFDHSTFSPEAIGFACWLTAQTQETILDLNSFWGDPNLYSYWTRRDIMCRNPRTGEWTDVHCFYDSTMEVDLYSPDYPTLTLGEVFTTAPEEFLACLVKAERSRQQTDDNWEDFLLYCLSGITSFKNERLTLNNDFYNYLLRKEIVISLDDGPFIGSLWDFLPLLRYQEEWKEEKLEEARQRWTNDIPF